MRHPKRVSVQNATAELRMAAFLQTAVAEADARRFETVLSWWTQAQPMQVCAHHCMRHDTTQYDTIRWCMTRYLIKFVA